MKKQIEDLIKVLQSEGYDNEEVHCEYDAILEKFILNKEFWYA
jgi:hypothetical protein